MTAVDLIQSVGFPIFVSLWFMFRMEKVINTNTEAMDKLRNSIDLKIVK